MIRNVLLVVASLVILSGCANTIRGAGQDTANTVDAAGDAAGNVAGAVN